MLIKLFKSPYVKSNQIISPLCPNRKKIETLTVCLHIVSLLISSTYDSVIENP